MPPRTRTELGLIAAAAACLLLARSFLPRTAAVSDLFLLGAVVLLVQGLVRDLVRVVRARGGAPSKVTCVCIESTLGLVAIAVGAVLSLAFPPIALTMTPLTWTIAFTGVALFGFATSDVVIDWQLRTLRREANHAAIVRLR